MAQVFAPSSNTVARLSILGVLAAPVVLLLALSSYSRSSFATKTDYALEQPVPFSHEHHVTELGLDCRYCHTTVEKSRFAGIPPTHTCMTCHSQIWTNSPLLQPIRESYRTGIPIVWNRVNYVPDFVYFDHSIHVNRGINCNVCHGPVQRMQITMKGNAFFMSFCVNCHRNPENYVRPRADEFELYNEFRSPQTLDAEKLAIRDGRDFQRSPAERKKGEALLKQYGVNKKQLTDCWTCHR